MTTILHTLKLIALLAGVSLMLASWVAYFITGIRMVKGRKEGVKPWGVQTGWNAFNLCFLPTLLTEKGLKARRWFFLCIPGFAVGFALAWWAM